MNFLNKKYTGLHANSPYQSNSRSFLPSSSSIRETPLSSNNCEAHPSEVVRHMCLECVELLCAECIGEHLEYHRQLNAIPKIVSIRQLRGEMENKIEHLCSLMSSQNPSQLDLESLRRHVVDKIDQMKKDLIRAVQDLVKVLKEHMVASLGFQEVAKTKNEMERLKDEVAQLQQSLSSNQAGIVKRIYQIDSEKLQESYKGMFVKFSQLQEKADFEITLNWKDIIKGIEDNIIVKQKTDEREDTENEALSPESQRESSEDRRRESRRESSGNLRREVEQD